MKLAGALSPKAKQSCAGPSKMVEVACGIPMMMQGYNLEDVARGLDE